jgi:hypothetical protein
VDSQAKLAKFLAPDKTDSAFWGGVGLRKVPHGRPGYLEGFIAGIREQTNAGN